MNQLLNDVRTTLTTSTTVTLRAAQNTALLKLEGVSKYYPGSDRVFTALSDIDLTIGKGEFVAIVGKSGSGKSTLLNLLAGLDLPSEGSVQYQSTLLSSLDETALARWRGDNIGIVFQFFQLIPTLSILENVLLAMSFANKIPTSQRRKRATQLLTDVGLTAHMNKFPSALSGGEQQRAAIARALANDPDILIADEPTGNLDQQTSAQINRLLQGLVQRGKTVLVVTHDRDNDAQYQRIIELSDGQIDHDSQEINA